MKKKFTFWIVLFAIVLSWSSQAFAQKKLSEEKSLIKRLQSAKVPEKKILALIELGQYYMRNDIGKADSIRLLINKRYSEFEGLVSFKIMLFTAEMLELTGDYNNYFQMVQRFRFFQDDALDKNDAFKKYLHLGVYYSSYLDEKGADQALTKALNYAEQIRSFSALTEVNCYLAYNKMLSNQKDTAIYFTEKAIQCARRSGYKRDLAKSFNYQAQVYDYFGQVEIAVAKNLVAYQLATSANDLLQMAQISREIGQKQLLITNYKDAEYYFSKSFDFGQQMNDIRQMGLAMASKAEVFRQQNKPTQSIRMNEAAIVYLQKVQDQNGLGMAHNNLGLVYKDLDAYPLAINQFNKSLVFYEKSVNKEKIAGVYHNVATIFKKQQRYQKALSYLQKSIQIQRNFGSRGNVYITYREMADIYKILGDTKKALGYMELYLDFTDDNSTLQASRKIAELSELYRSEQRDRLISMQADSLQKQMQEKELTQAKLENISLRTNLQTYVIIGFLIIIILAAMIGISRYNQNLISQKQKEAEMSQTLLRTQMNPHFIFNAMSVIQSYIYENDVKNSSKFLVNFSRLMRLILENSPKEFISIETEMEILQKYLETQKLRFEERFDFELTCDEDLHFDRALIPPMITQPFIENAIEHGQLHNVENGKISVRFFKYEGMLHVEIEDNGIGRKGAEKQNKASNHKSMAMQITKQRIENLNFKYKADGKLFVSDLDQVLQTGTKVLISLPYKQDISEIGQNEQVA